MKPVCLSRSVMSTPYSYRLCTTPKMFESELKRLKVQARDRPVFLSKTAGACCVELERADGALLIIVNIAIVKGRKWPFIASMLAHEAVHIWQLTRRELGESDPSDELEAYAIENISRNLMEEYVRQSK